MSYTKYFWEDVVGATFKKSYYYFILYFIGSRPSDHYFRSVCLSVSLSVCCAEFFSAVFDLISMKVGHMLYVWV